MTSNYLHRPDGRRPGQGWGMENETGHYMRNIDSINFRWAETRTRLWGVEIDVAAGERKADEPRSREQPPVRILAQSKDWYCGRYITPAVLWRLIALAMTARAEPVLIHHHNAELTGPAQRIAEKWRVRLLTDREVLDGAPLPEPEQPDFGANHQYPSIFEKTTPIRARWAPDYHGRLTPEVAKDVFYTF